jgi:hypothetical protein
MWKHTEFLLDDLEDLLLVKFLGDSLDRCQGLTTISLCSCSQQTVSKSGLLNVR